MTRLTRARMTPGARTAVALALGSFVLYNANVRGDQLAGHHSDAGAPARGGRARASRPRSPVPGLAGRPPAPLLDPARRRALSVQLSRRPGAPGRSRLRGARPPGRRRQLARPERPREARRVPVRGRVRRLRVPRRPGAGPPAGERRGGGPGDGGRLRGRHADVGDREPGPVGARPGAAGPGRGALGAPPARGRPGGGRLLGGLAAGVMVASRPSTGLVAAVLAGFALLSRGRAGLLFAGALGAVLAAVAAHNLAIFGSVQGGYAELHRTHAEHHGVASAWSGSLGEGLARGAREPEPRALRLLARYCSSPRRVCSLWLVRRRGGLLACAARRRRGGRRGPSRSSRSGGAATRSGPACSADVLPALVLGVVPVWPAIRRRPAWRWLFAGAFAASVLVEAVGAFYYPVAPLRGLEHEPPRTSTSPTSGSGTGAIPSCSACSGTGP